MHARQLPAHAQPAGRVPELDVFRGLAALLMVVNHLGYVVLSPYGSTHGVAGAIIFLGSFAPVLFFFAAGFGGGLSAGGRRFAPLLDKVLWLVLADQFLAWRFGSPAVLDFFGFIALSMALVWAVQRAPRPVLLAWALIVAVCVARYVVGPRTGLSVDGPVVLRWLLGVKDVGAVSYPAAPWLVYPLLGFVLAAALRGGGGRLSRRAWLAVGLAVGASLALAALLAWRGVSFHRWGTVASGFFVLSVGVVLGFMALAWWLQRRAPRAAALLSLSGVASFAVVPIHYAIARGGIVPAHESLAAYLLAASAAVVASFVLARAFERAVETGAPAAPRLWLLALGVVACAVAAYALGAAGRLEAAQWASSIGQLAVVVFFARRISFATLLPPIARLSRSAAR